MKKAFIKKTFASEYLKLGTEKPNKVSYFILGTQTICLTLINISLYWYRLAADVMEKNHGVLVDITLAMSPQFVLATEKVSWGILEKVWPAGQGR